VGDNEVMLTAGEVIDSDTVLETPAEVVTETVAVVPGSTAHCPFGPEGTGTSKVIADADHEVMTKVAAFPGAPQLVDPSEKLT
jgi:hypothetical protein